MLRHQLSSIQDEQNKHDHKGIQINANMTFSYIIYVINITYNNLVF